MHARHESIFLHAYALKIDPLLQCWVCDNTHPPQHGVVRILIFATFHVRGLTSNKSASKVSKYQAFNRLPDIRYHLHRRSLLSRIRGACCSRGGIYVARSGTKNNSLARSLPWDICTIRMYPHAMGATDSGNGGLDLSRVMGSPQLYRGCESERDNQAL